MAKKPEQLSLSDLTEGLKSANMSGMSDAIAEQIRLAQEQINLSQEDHVLNVSQTAASNDIKKNEDEVIKLLKKGLIDKTGDGLNSNMVKLIREVAILSGNLKSPKQTKKSDLSENDIENSKVQNDQLELLAKIEENTRPGQAATAPEPAAGGGGFLSGLGKGIKSLGSGMSGMAKNLLAFAGALWITAKALQEFAKVEWMAIVKGGIAITGLAIAAKIAGSGDAHKSILALGVGVLALAYGLNKFADVEWGGILKGTVAMFALATAAKVAGSGDAYKSILALGAGTILLAYGLNKFGDVSWGNIITGTVAMFALAAAAKAAGSGDAWKSILALGAGTIALAFGLKKFEEVGWGSILKGVTVIAALGIAAKGLTEAKDGIIAMLALGAALWVTSKAFENFAALDWGGILKAVVSLGVFVAGAIAIGAVSGELLVGAAAMLVLAGATWAFGKALQTFADVKWSDILVGVAGMAAFTVGIMALGAAMMTGVGALLLGAGVAALLAMSVAIGAFGIAAKLAGEGMSEFTDGFTRLASIDGGNLFKVAAGIGAIGAALLVFGAAQMVAALENLVTKFLSLGDDTPVEQLIKIGEAGPGIDQAATGLERLAAAMKAFGDIDEDALDAAVEAAEDIAEAFEDNAITINVGSGSTPTAAATPAPTSSAATPAPTSSAATPAPTSSAATPVKKAPMTNAAPSVSNTSESVSGTLKGVTGDQIKGHPNYKKYYDQAISEGASPESAQEDATDAVKVDMVKEQQVNPQQVTPAPAKANGVYNQSAQVAAGDKTQPQQKASTVVSAPTQINNSTQNAVVKSPARNQDNSVMGYIKSRFA